MSASIPGDREAVAVHKRALRDQLETARDRLSADQLRAAADAIAERAVAVPVVAQAETIAAYVSVGAEPGTARLLDALTEAGIRVLLPITVRDPAGYLDLDWGTYEGRDSLVRTTYGLWEPGGQPLGRAAIATADVVLAPGMAVSAAGVRIGKGAGCYDRALTRTAANTPVLVVLYDDEVGQDVPAEPHDRRVDGAITPSAVTWFDSGPD